MRALLAQSGFAVSERCDMRPVSFDLVARRDHDLIVLKVLQNVDALSEEMAKEIQLICNFLEARPVLVGLRAGTGELEDGVVYARYAIPIVTPATIEDYLLRGSSPLVFAAPGGFYVHMDHERLRRAREQLNLSLGALAQIAGVSRRAIQMYEAGMNASIDAAMRLEDHLGMDLIEPLDPFRMLRADASRDRLAGLAATGSGASVDADTPPSDAQGVPAPIAGTTGHRGEAAPSAGDPLEGLITRLLEAAGYTVQATRRSPFNALSTQQGDTLLTGMGRDSPHLRRRARIVTSVSRVMERPGFFVVERATRTHLEGTPVVSRHELRSLTDAEAILSLIMERQPRRTH